MLTANPGLGTGFHGIGALSASTCYTPQKKVRGWSWHTYWITQASFCWFLLPIIGAYFTIPDLRAVLHEAPGGAMEKSFLLGMAYGIGGTAFGASIRYIGFSLTYAIAIGISSVLGTLVPLVQHHQVMSKWHEPGGHFVFLGVAIGTIGIAVTGWAGRIKELGLRDHAKEADADIPSLPATPGVEPASMATAEAMAHESAVAAQNEPAFSIGIGLVLSILAGVLSAVYSFALAAGDPIATIAEAHNAGPWKGNVVFIFANSGAFLTTLLYCTWLHLRHRSFGEFFRLPRQDSSAQLGRNFLLAALTGFLWYGQFFFYQLGVVYLGKEFDYCNWSMHMTMLVLFSGLIALILKEWHHSRRSAQFLFVLSMAILVVGVLSQGYGSYLGSK